MRIPQPPTSPPEALNAPRLCRANTHPRHLHPTFTHTLRTVAGGGVLKVSRRESITNTSTSGNSKRWPPVSLAPPFHAKALQRLSSVAATPTPEARISFAPSLAQLLGARTRVRLPIAERSVRCWDAA